MRTLLTRIAALFRSRRLDSDLTEEVAVHLAMLEEEFRARGMSPDQARLAARREFGGVTQMQEAYRDRRGVPWLETSLRDVRYALRGFRRNPGFATAAVLSLALGIGANAAVFSLVYPLLIRSLPVPHPEELVSLYQTGGSDGIASYPLYREFATRTDLFQGVAATVGSGSEVPIGVGPGAAPQLATVEGVSGNYFHTLEVPPALGSVFGGETSEPAAVLSYDFWQRRFAADPRIVGRTIRWRKRSLAVIGVAAPGFYGVHIDRRTDLWLPISSDDFEIENPGADWLRIVARRRPEVPIERIQSAIAVLYAQFARTAFAGYDAPLRNLVMKRRVEARSARAGLSPVRERFGGPLLALLAVVSVVLLLSCANVANLLLARGAARRKETAMRLSLGASRARLVRQALAETAVLAVCGGALGALLAVWGKRYAVQFLPERLGDPFGSGLGGAVLAFALGISLVSAILFGLAPALHSAAVDPAEGLRGAGGDRGRPTFRRTLVAAQIALSVVLVLLAGLFTRSLAALRSVGFRDANVIRFQLVLPPEWKRAEAEAAGKRFRAALASVPGVASVSSGSGPYEIGTTSMGPVRVPGSAKTAVTPALVNMMRVAPRYFETLGSPPVLGREFEPGEGTWPPKAVIVNQEFVREFLPGEKQPVGRGVIFANEKLAQPIPIAGVVGDLPHKGLREKAAPLVYSPGRGVHRGAPDRSGAGRAARYPAGTGEGRTWVGHLGSPGDSAADRRLHFPGSPPRHHQRLLRSARAAARRRRRLWRGGLPDGPAHIGDRRPHRPGRRARQRGMARSPGRARARRAGSRRRLARCIRRGAGRRRGGLRRQARRSLALHWYCRRSARRRRSRGHHSCAPRFRHGPHARSPPRVVLRPASVAWALLPAVCPLMGTPGPGSRQQSRRNRRLQPPCYSDPRAISHAPPCLPPARRGAPLVRRYRPPRR
ncbi:MAG: ABC transporter permease [Acidobacteriia bacterium]|nr:ABC transporter permease [Terriglobia bacterium]